MVRVLPAEMGKVLDSLYVLKVEPWALLRGWLDVGWERKRGVKTEFRAFDLNN
jgi:hypothetical protein